MPKKSRRAKAKRRAAVAQAVQEGRLPQSRVVSAQAQPPTRISTSVPAQKVEDPTGRYQYVISEIKRIGIIAGSIIVVLIILSFILG